MLKSLSIVALLAVVSCTYDPEDAPVTELSSVYYQIPENSTTTIYANMFAAEDQSSAPTYSNSKPAHGTVTASGAVFTYTADADYNGTDQFTIVRTTKDGETDIPVVITVTHVDIAPVAQDLQVVFTRDESTTTALLALDPDSTVLTYRVVTPPAHGTLIGPPPALVYAPNKGYVGMDGFTFKANDGFLDSQLGVVTLTINAQ